MGTYCYQGPVDKLRGDTRCSLLLTPTLHSYAGYHLLHLLICYPSCSWAPPPHITIIQLRSKTEMRKLASHWEMCGSTHLDQNNFLPREK